MEDELGVNILKQKLGKQNISWDFQQEKMQ